MFRPDRRFRLLFSRFPMMDLLIAVLLLWGALTPACADEPTIKDLEKRAAGSEKHPTPSHVQPRRKPVHVEPPKISAKQQQEISRLKQRVSQLDKDIDDLNKQKQAQERYRKDAILFHSNKADIENKLNVINAQLTAKEREKRSAMETLRKMQ